MKSLALPLLLISVLILSCERTDNQGLNEFCSVIPEGWDCEVMQQDFNPALIPGNVDTPLAIIKYTHPGRTFTAMKDTEVNPSVILDLYSVQRKEELLALIRSQQVYSCCIPIYYGETTEYFIITSPCFVNGGYATEEAKSCIQDLISALKTIITVNEYDFMGDQVLAGLPGSNSV